MKKNILAPAVALSLGLTGSLGAIAAPAYADGSQQVYEPKVALSKDKLTASEYSTDGVTITLKDGKPGNEYTVVVEKDGVEVEGAGGRKNADNNGAVSVKVVGKGDGLVGDYTVQVFDPAGRQRVAELDYTVTKDDDEQPGDDAPGKGPVLNLSDKKVTADDFVNDKKGVNAVVSNLEPGTEVKFNVAGTSGNAKNVRPYKQTVKADKDGNAVFSIAGTSKDNPSAYLGKYTVTAEFDGQKLEDSFEVVSGKGGKNDSEEPGTGGGSVSDGTSDDMSGSSDSGTLPRTGQGLGGLAAGAALLTVGGAAVLLTRRTRKA